MRRYPDTSFSFLKWLWTNSHIQKGTPVEYKSTICQFGELRQIASDRSINMQRIPKLINASLLLFPFQQLPDETQLFGSIKSKDLSLIQFSFEDVSRKETRSVISKECHDFRDREEGGLTFSTGRNDYAKIRRGLKMVVPCPKCGKDFNRKTPCRSEDEIVQATVSQLTQTPGAVGGINFMPLIDLLRSCNRSIERMISQIKLIEELTVELKSELALFE